MRIEFLGPSGVGKSTLLKMAQSNLHNDTDWIGPEKCDNLYKNFMICGQGGGDNINNLVPQNYSKMCFDIINRSSMQLSQKFSAFNILNRTCETYIKATKVLKKRNILVHDELFLHRALSVLPYSTDFDSDVRMYFSVVPVPDLAIVCQCGIDEIKSRTLNRGAIPNCYAGKNEEELTEIIRNSLEICKKAKVILESRGVIVKELDMSLPLEVNIEKLNKIISELLEKQMAELRKKLIDTSRSFKKKLSRHFLRTPDVIYCSFETKKFVVTKEESQRDSKMRIERFGIDRSNINGKSVLDLGSNCGAMLFQLSNYGIDKGLGVEYDEDKVKISEEISRISEIDNLSFYQGDIDLLDAGELGAFDVVLALAIEAHIMNRERLFELLKKVTKEVLYFEGNSRCNIYEITSVLLEKGFKSVEYIGFCNDDIRKENNNRPMLKAYK